MPAPLSVVIPTLNAAAALAGLLPDLVEGLAAGLIREVVITDGGSTDDIAALAETVGALFVAGPAGRDGQIGRGCAMARGEWLLILNPGSRLPAGWTAIVREAMDHPGRTHVFRVHARNGGIWPRLRAGLINLRTRILRRAHVDQALLVSRASCRRAGEPSGQVEAVETQLTRAVAGRVYLLPAAIGQRSAPWRGA